MCYSALLKRNLDYLQQRYGAIAVREDYADYESRSRHDPKLFPALQDRIFPGHYAPVICLREQQRVVELMRYGAYPAPMVLHANKYTTFNARRDNLLSKFWSNAFMQHHGFVVLEAFYEWVAVADLLKAHVVSLTAVEAQFAKAAQERRQKIEAQGKKYKPTATELKDPRFRQTIIEFRPADGAEILAPVIFSYKQLPGGRLDKGFAIVTDDPPLEVQAAGHDRCPIALKSAAVAEWMQLQKKTAADFFAILTQRQTLSFQHALATAG